MQIPSISMKSWGALLALLLAAALFSASAAAQDGLGELGELGEEAGRHALEPPDTSSPRATLRSFLNDAREAWTIFLTSDESRRERHHQAGRRLGRATLCLDLTEVGGRAGRTDAVGDSSHEHRAPTDRGGPARG
jgi:hypothetical protein